MVISLPGYSRARLASICSGCSLAGAAGGTSCKDVLEEAAKLNRGELEDGFEEVFGDDDTEEATDAEEPNTAGLFGREEGSVLWQLLIANRINNANP